VSQEGVISEHPGAPANGLADDRPVATPGRRVKKGERLSEEHRRKVSEGVKRAAAERKAQSEGKRSGDRPPKPKTSIPPADTKAADLASIREMLGMVLVAPSALGAMRGDAWLTGHFMQRGPELSDAIVDEAARNDAFRAYLAKLAAAARGATLIGALAMYVAPPLMHFGIVPGAAMLGVPVVAPPATGGPPPQGAPVPGRSPQFVAPERGPATAPEPVADPLEAELVEDAPPLPIEPV
jgi:hypothetical protein